MQNHSPIISEPWYRQFWPWFLILLPGSVVVAGLAMVYIAFKHADSTVNDHYYRDGLAINQVLSQDRAASAQQVRARLNWDYLTGELLVDLSTTGVYPRQLQLLMLHPTDQQRDRTVLLEAIAAGRYRADLETQPQHRYYLRLLPLPEQTWRLNGEIDFSEAPQQSALAPRL